MICMYVHESRMNQSFGTPGSSFHSESICPRSPQNSPVSCDTRVRPHPDKREPQKTPTSRRPHRPRVLPPLPRSRTLAPTTVSDAPARYTSPNHRAPGEGKPLRPAYRPS